MEPILVLIHSPLVGPFTWALVEEQLRARGVSTARPTLTNRPSETPFWAQHAATIAAAVAATVEAEARSLEDIRSERPVVLIAHSGAGPLLPAVRQAVRQPVIGYIFVDAGWPENGKSRLDLFGNAEEVAQLRQSAQDGLLPTWTDEDLAPLIPDDAVRRQFVSELRSMPLAVYEEALPVFRGWPDAPCGYIRFGENPAYDWSFAQARQSGCPAKKMEGQHFHLLVDPQGVALAILEMLGRMSEGPMSGKSLPGR